MALWWLDLALGRFQRYRRWRGGHWRRLQCRDTLGTGWFRNTYVMDCERQLDEERYA